MRDPFADPFQDPFPPRPAGKVVPMPPRGQTAANGSTQTAPEPQPANGQVARKSGAYKPDYEIADLIDRLRADATATPENFLALAQKMNDVIQYAAAIGSRVRQNTALTLEDRVLAELDRLRARQEAERRFREETGTAETPLAASVVDAVNLNDLPDPVPLIPGVLNRESYAILTGRDGSMKTFVALDWALSLATGEPWNGKRVYPIRNRPKVLFMVGEGQSGFKKRVAAWSKARGVEIPEDRFLALFERVNFYRNQARVDELVQFVQEEGVGLVVLDHLRLISGGADGNSSDMGLVVDNIKRLVEATAGGSVLVIAHTDKGDKDTRGFSGIEDDSDTVWHAAKPEDASMVTLKNTKMKDEAAHPDLTLTPEVVELGVNQHTGNPITSLVLKGQDPFQLQDRNPTQDRILELIRENYSAIGVSQSELREVLNLAKGSCSRAVNGLVKSGALVLRGQKYYLNPAAVVAGDPAAEEADTPAAVEKQNSPAALPPSLDATA